VSHASYRIVYRPAARAKLLDWTHWRTGSDIDAAVMTFSAEHAATVQGGPVYVLHAAGHRVFLTIEHRERTVYVLRIYRAP
jgi:hypothetical protein